MTDTAFHQFKLRMPLDLFRRLEGEADSSNRSVSSEIIQRLEESFRPREPEGKGNLESRVHAHYTSTLETLAILQALHEAHSAELEQAKPRSKEAKELSAKLELDSTAIDRFNVQRTALFHLIGMIAIEKAYGRPVTDEFIEELIDRFNVRYLLGHTWSR